VDGAGAKASRLRHRRLRVFFESLPIPTDASNAYRPDPLANNKACHPPRHGMVTPSFFLSLTIKALAKYIEKRQDTLLKYI